MSSSNFIALLCENDSVTRQALIKRIEQVINVIASHNLQYDGPHFYYPELRTEKRVNYTLEPHDVQNKEDLLWLSSLLPVLRKEKTTRSSILASQITHMFGKYSLNKVGFTEAELYNFIFNWQEDKEDYTFRWNINKLFSIVKKKIAENGLTNSLQKTLMLFQTPESSYMYIEQRKINEQIAHLLQEPSAVPVNLHDMWGPVVLNFIDSLQDEKEKHDWIELIQFCLSVGDKSYPPKNWLPKAETLLNKVGHDSFATKLSEWLSFTSELIIAIHKNERNDFLRDVNHDLLKTLIWCAGLANNSELTIALDKYASIAYKKKPGLGPVSSKTGNACMYAFSLLPFKEAVTRLMKFRNRIINNTILKSIDKIIGQVAERSGKDKELLEEIGVMDFGLKENGEKVLLFDNISAIIKVSSNHVMLSWTKDGKEVKAVPALIKSNYKSIYKELTSEIKEITAQLQVQKNRIESYYLRKKSWNFNDWLQNYIQHPLVKVIAQKLIWTFKNEQGLETGFYDKECFVNVQGQHLSNLNENTEVLLWHPILSTVEEVVSWRKFLQEREVTQPFKQAYREIYVLTEAELRTDTYSNRFAAHILRQHQFAALCKQRNWSYHLMGMWDSHNTPTLSLPSYKIVAQYYVDQISEETNDIGILSYVVTDQVRFYYDGDQISLIDVPKLVLSEVMRDVDLFVGVTSIGNDPDWTDSANNDFGTYWRSYSFGDLTETAKMRSEVLQQLAPRLKIRDKCYLEGKFLVVKGQLRTYKIHMGSGNILMEPNDEYLCIVPAGKKEKEREKIYLPFEGDNLLSIIISKALLLAEDDKIKDETILRQIKRKGQ